MNCRKVITKSLYAAPVLESLESKLLMSGTVGLAVAGGVLTITGDTADNSIVIEDTGVGSFKITGIDGTSVRYNNVTSDPDTEVAVAAGAYGLTVNFGQGGNDTISAVNRLTLSDATGVRYAFSYTGGAGNDNLFKATGSTGMLAVLDPIIDDEQQTLGVTATPVDGTFSFTYKGKTSAEIDFDATAATVQAELRKVEGMEDVIVTGGPFSDADFTFKFPAMGNVPLLNVTSTMRDALDEQQTLSVSGTPADGDFTVTFDGNSSDAIAFDADAADVQTALRLVAGMEDVTVTGGPFGTADFVVTFPGSGDVPLMTVVSTMVDGDEAAVTVEAETTAGNIVQPVATTTAGPQDEVQKLTSSIDPTAGTFKINFRGAQTAAIAFDADAATVQAALRAVDGMETVTVTGGPFGTADFVVTFHDMGNVPLLVVNTTNLTGLVDEVQTLTPSAVPTAGTFIINYRGESTAEIDFDADAADVQAALRLIPGLEAVTVADGPFADGAFTVTFPAMGDVDALTVSDGETPLTDTDDAAVTVAVAEDTKGIALDEVQTITASIVPTAGTFKINYGSESTADIAFGANAAAVQAALRLIPGLSAVTVTGGPLATADYVVTFPAMGDVSLLTITSAMTGAGSAAVTVTADETTQGGVNPVTVATETTASLMAALTATATVTITDSASEAAVGSLTFLSNPKAGDRITLNDGAGNVRIYQAVTGAPNRLLGQFQVKATAALTMADFKTTLNGAAPMGITASNVIAVDEVQTLTSSIAPTAGTFKITYGGNSTTDLAFGATAAQVQTALRLLAGLGSVAVTGNPLATGGYTVTFPAAMGDVALLTVANGATALTGAAAAAVTVTAKETVTGVALNAAKCVLTNDNPGMAGNQAITISTFAAARIKATNLTGGGSTNVSDDDTITLNDGTNPAVTFTFGTDDGDVPIGATKAATAANLADAINNAELLAITAVDNGDGTISLTQDAAGIEGNTTIVDNSPNITATPFTGGLDGTTLADGDTVTLDDGVNDPVVFTARENPTLDHEFAIGGSAVRTMANVIAAINAANAAGDVGIAATDNFDGSANLTNDNTGVGGNQTVGTTGDNFVGSGMEAGLGSSMDALSYTAVLGAGTNYAGLSAGGSGQSYIWGDVSITGGANDDTVSFYGVYVAGNVTLTLATSTAADTVEMQDDGTYSVYIGGNLSITQTDGLSTVTLQDAIDNMFIGGNATINVGNTAAGTSVTTLENIAIDGQLLYTGGTGNDDLELVGFVDVGDLANVNMGSGTGTNTFHASAPETQTFTPSGSPDAGNWTLSLGDLESAPLRFDATAADVQAALRDIAGMEDVTVTGGGFDTGDAFVVTFPDTMGEVDPLTFTATALKEGVTSVTVEVTKDLTGFSVGAATGGGLTYTGGSGDDTVTLNGANTHNGAGTFTMGEGANALTIRIGIVDGAFSYTGGAGADTIALGQSSFLNRGSFTASPGAGANRLDLDNATVNGFTYTGGAGNDTLVIGATAFTNTAAFTVTAGDGTNSLTMDNAVIVGNVAYTGGIAGDAVNIGADSFDGRGTMAFTPNTGANSVTLNGRSRGVTFTGTTGADTLTMGTRAGSGGYAIDGDLTFTAGGGGDALVFDGSVRNLTYTGGANDDAYTLGAGTESVFNARGNVTIIGGLGTNAGIIKNANIRGNFTYTGGDGVDTLNVGQDAGTGMIVAKTTNITLAGGADVLKIDDSTFNQVSGTFTVTTGLGADTIKIDVGANSSTTFYRAVKFDNTAGGDDSFTDRAVVGSAGTHYLAATLLTRPVFTGFHAAGATINGTTLTGTILGDAMILPTYN